MADEWLNTTLGQVTDFLSGGTPSKEMLQYWCGSIPWVSAKDMKHFRLDDTEDHVTEDGLANGTKIIPSGTVLLLARGMTLLNDLPICVVNRPMTFNQDVKALRPKLGVRNEFLPYLLLGNKDRLLNLVDLAGHGTGRLNTDELNALDVVLPPEPEQRAIAHILGTLDDKIELIRRMNETLEAMAQALFKSWFVDFDPVRAKAEGRDTGLPTTVADLFSDSFQESEQGEIPKGWRMGTVSEFAALSRGAINPCDYPDEAFDHFSIPAFDEGRRPRTENGAEIKSNKFIVPPDSVLLSKLNPRIPRIWLPVLRDNHRAVCSTEFFVMLPRTGISPEFLYSFLWSDAFAGVFESLVTGTSGSHQRVKPEGLLAMDAIVPPQSLIHEFTDLVRPLLQRDRYGRQESQNLVALRETLLPKLISGELRVPDADLGVEEICT